jgi:hypothetical protein
MAKPLMLSIGGQNTQADVHQVTQEHPLQNDPKSEPSEIDPTQHSTESLAGIYEILKRHEESLRDLIVEIRLLYHNLPEKERNRLEAQRDRTTHEVRDLFAGQVRSLDETILRLRGKKIE